ncbi:Leucine-rich repeat - like 10, partial [Theobroma cacao]
MAEGVLFDIAEKVLEHLGSSALQELSLASNVKAELTKLEEIVSIIKAVLLDAEEQHNSNNQGVKVWLKQLKDAVYDVDDLLDDFSTEVLQRKTMKGNEISKKVRIFFSKSNQLSYRLKLGHRVKASSGKLEAISANIIKFRFNERLVESQIQSSEREQTHSFVRLEEVIGRYGDKNAIIELLLETNSEESIRVVPIVGIGGLGKTTLAQMAFNDEKVRAHFELKIWLWKKILEAAAQKKVQQNCQLETLQNDLRKEIDGKKYLLVLDDVWNEDAQKWSMVKSLLMGGARGSRIVVTTRSELVERVVGTISPYFLKGLSESQSLSLFKQITFEKQIQTSNFLDLELETIGEKIVKYCARVHWKLFCLERTKSKWSRVLENITQQGTGIEPILRLSYDHLPSHLKQCFAYYFLFPKDYRISKHALINLWMAQGFIQSPDRGQSLENVGYDYFMDLLWRSFFQEAEKDYFGNIVSCKMHDLMHDLAKSVAGSECFYVTNLDVENLNESTRHVSFGEKIDFLQKISSVSPRVNKIRTFFQPFTFEGIELRYSSLSVPLSLNENESSRDKLIRSFKCLRMLDLRCSRFEKVPHSICRLKHLRYLDLSMNDYIRKVPNFVTRLHNLQTLDLSSCINLEELPRDIGNMVRLTHLEIDKCNRLRYMPRGLGQLTCLTSLPMFKINKRDRHVGGAKLNNLGGQLSIESLTDATLESGTAYLEEKLYLESLFLSWSWDEYNSQWDEEEVLESLQPHPNLKELQVWMFHGAKFLNWLSSITKLVQIHLNFCKKLRNLPLMDHLPSLKDLDLDGLDALEHMSDIDTLTATTFFPSLKFLKISRRRKEDDEDDEESTTELLPHFPCLSTLTIWGCPNLTSFPLFPTLNDELSLRITSGRLLQQTTRMRTKGKITSIATTLSSTTVPLSNLKSLRLSGMENVESVLKEFLQNCRCTSLESLEIECCPELT